MTNNQRKSQLNKLADANALIFAAIDDLTEESLEPQEPDYIADDIDQAINILREVSRFLKSQKKYE